MVSEITAVHCSGALRFRRGRSTRPGAKPCGGTDEPQLFAQRLRQGASAGISGADEQNHRPSFRRNRIDPFHYTTPFAIAATIIAFSGKTRIGARICRHKKENFKKREKSTEKLLHFSRDYDKITLADYQLRITEEVKEVAEHQVRHEACEGEQKEEPAESYGEDGR